MFYLNESGASWRFVFISLYILITPTRCVMRSNPEFRYVQFNIYSPAEWEKRAPRMTKGKTNISNPATNPRAITRETTAAPLSSIPNKIITRVDINNISSTTKQFHTVLSLLLRYPCQSLAGSRALLIRPLRLCIGVGEDIKIKIKLLRTRLCISLLGRIAHRWFPNLYLPAGLKRAVDWLAQRFG